MIQQATPLTSLMPKRPSDKPRALPYQGGEEATAAQVLRQFRIVFNAIRSHFQQVEWQAGIGGAQVWALHALSSQPGMRVSDLAQVMDIHPSTASNLVRQLTKRGLVRTDPSSTDRRSVMLYVEPAGREVLDKVPGPFQGVLPEALGLLSPQTLHQLRKNLGALIEVLHADEQAGGIPLGEL